MASEWLGVVRILLAGSSLTAQPADYFVEKLSEGVGTIAAAFYPKPVIVRLSDFKTNEYAQLLGGGPVIRRFVVGHRKLRFN